jgi:AraC-like DNA-binding protein/ligand-binding sensor protein
MREVNTADAGNQSGTHPVLIKAWKLMLAYAQATGSMAFVLDHNYMPIPEVLSSILSEKNFCLYCTRHRSGVTVKGPQDLAANPCRDMHLDALKKAASGGGPVGYTCEAGFVFWASPIYLDGSLIGSILGTGFLAKPPAEAAALLSAYSRGEVSENELCAALSSFPLSETGKIAALEELLHVCAESLSSGSEDCYETMRRRTAQQERLNARIEELKRERAAGTELPSYPIDKERLLLSALRRGEKESASELLNDILAVLALVNHSDFKYMQFRAVELVVLLSRADINPGHTDKALLAANDYYIKQVQNSKNIEELTDVLYAILDRMAGHIISFQGIRHASALKKAERLIVENFSRKISLQEIADASGLSAPYFSTIFKEEMGENLSKYINRLRVEKSCRMLLDTKLSLSEIASACGFEDQSWFSKIFKTHTGTSPGKYRSQGGGVVREISEKNLSQAYLDTLRDEKK